MSRRIILFAAVLGASLGTARQSPYVLLFESSKARAVEGLQRQKARQHLAQAEFRRFSNLVGSGAVSRQEFEEARAAAVLSELDKKIAMTKVQQAELALKLARTLVEAGKKIAVCKRNPQIDENTTSPILTKLTKHPRSRFSNMALTPNFGTQVKVPDIDLPPPPRPNEIQKPDPPSQPTIPDINKPDSPEAPTTNGGGKAPPTKRPINPKKPSQM